jgi:hypothetical protein
MMNLDDILLLPDLSLSQSLEKLEQQLHEWREKQLNKIEISFNESIKKLHLFYQKSVNDFEQAKIKLMDDFNLIVDQCSSFTIDELDMYLKSILKNVEKLKDIKTIQLNESDLSMNVNFQPILLSEWIDPFKINFSQTTVHGNTYLDYKISMQIGRWVWDRHPDERQKSSALKVAQINGHFVSFDNRRLLAAQENHLKYVPIIKVNLDDLRPTTSMTWRKAFENRLRQSKLPLEGTSAQPSLKF